MGTSVLHIKTEVECRVYLFDEEKGIAKPGTYFNLEVRKGEQDLLFVSTEDETSRCQMQYNVEENDCDYRMIIERSQFAEGKNNMQSEKQDDAEAQCQLGDCCFDKKEWREAAKRYRKAAEQGHSRAQCNLGVCYDNGWGVEQDHAEAVRWFHKAAEQGDADAQYKLGEDCCLKECFYIGGGYEEAVRWFRKAAERGHTDAQYHLGNCYEYGHGVEQDYAEAAKWYRRAALQGDSNAQYNLGKCYYYGHGVVQDYAEAVKWYRKSAVQGHEYAQCDLGACYKNGHGVEQDNANAVKWIHKAAEREDANADLIYILEVCSANSQGVEYDFAEAVKWFYKVADQGNADAQYILGVFYYNGRGVEHDYAEAVKWFHKAAEQGDASAQYILGMCYNNGQGVEQDYTNAVKWYRKAVEQGNCYAQYQLGYCYENGNGVERDWFKAMKWFRKAAEQGDDDAQYQLNRIENNLRGLIDSGFYGKPYFIFFDTETTGVPRDYNAPASNTRNWPRLVQLGWIVTDEEGNVLSQGNEIVKPEGFVIPADAARVHGITTEKARREGKPLREVIEAFLKDAKDVKCIVGHNISFDQKVVGAELYRLGIPDTISTAKSLCTMQAGTDYCKIPGYYGYKWPKLQELHHKLFGCDFVDAHDAMADIAATKKCFFEMRKRGLI